MHYQRFSFFHHRKLIHRSSISTIFGIMHTGSHQFKTDLQKKPIDIPIFPIEAYKKTQRLKTN